MEKCSIQGGHKLGLEGKIVSPFIYNSVSSQHLFFFQRQDRFEQRDPQDRGGGWIRGGVRWNLQGHRQCRSQAGCSTRSVHSF